MSFVLVTNQLIVSVETSCVSSVKTRFGGMGLGTGCTCTCLVLLLYMTPMISLVSLNQMNPITKCNWFCEFQSF